jgi:nucleotide-binding universal stress UspA family protein
VTAASDIDCGEADAVFIEVPMSSFRPKLILVATDFSKTADEALHYASAIAERNGARLVVIYADELIPPLDETSASLAHATLDELVAAAHENLMAYVERNVSRYVPFIARVVVGSAVPAIVQQAKEWKADLVVMGTHGRTGFRRLVVGSVCESVLKAIDVPVIAVSNAAAKQSSPEIRKIVCSVEYSPECADALRIAAALAPEARLVLIKADEGESTPQSSDRLLRLRRWLPPELVDRCELKLVGALTAEHLASFAAMIGADLIATGAPPAHGIGDLLRGTATDRIVQHSECPVLVVNAHAVRTEPAGEQPVLVAVGR